MIALEVYYIMEIKESCHKIVQMLESAEIGSEGAFKVSEVLAKKLSEQFPSVSVTKDKSIQENLILAAMFRDIGKFNVGEAIFNSKDIFKPDDTRWEVIKEHPRKSIEILKKYDKSLSQEVFEIIKYHHPWYFDESNGACSFDKVSNSVTTSLHIVSIIDAYIGLRAKRARRRQYNHVEAMTEIQKDMANGKFLGTLVLYLDLPLEEAYEGFFKVN